jgi:hypothetical protein
MGFIQVATTENLRIRITEELFAKQPSDSVVQRIADNGRNDHQCHHQMHVQIVRRQRRQRAGHEQQRIAGQEWRHHQTRFAEQNQKQNGVYPDAILATSSAR